MTEELATKFRGLDKPDVPLSQAIEYFAIQRYSGNSSRATRELLRLIKQGKISASGIAKDGERLPIPANDFLSLIIPSFGSPYTGFSTNLLVWANSRVRDAIGIVRAVGDSIEQDRRITWRNICVTREELLQIASARTKAERLIVEASKPISTSQNARKPTQKLIEAKKFLKEIFPQGIPSKEEVSNSELVRRVMGLADFKILEKRSLAPGRDTILREAGRRRR